MRLSEALTLLFKEAEERIPNWTSEVCSALGSVGKTNLEHWASGRDVPPPDHLDSLILLVSDDSRFDPVHLENLKKVLDLPLREAVHIPSLPPSQYHHPTLRHYIFDIRRKAFMKNLECLPLEDQTRLLAEFQERVLVLMKR